MNWRYSEEFYSIQGEGKFVGVPSVFLRMFGCNFRCKNFGRSKDETFAKNEPNPEVQEVIDNIDIVALCFSSTGKCDYVRNPIQTDHPISNIC